MGIALTMLRCHEVSKLVSEWMHRDLPLGQRLAVRLHLMIWRLCSGFARQSRVLDVIRPGLAAEYVNRPLTIGSLPLTVFRPWGGSPARKVLPGG